MLPKSKRLNTELFGDIIKKGQSFHCPFLILRAVKSDESSRFAITVPKKVAKTAIERNRIRKQIYTIIKDFEGRIMVKVNVVLIAKAGLEKLSYQDISKEINNIFVKSSLIK